jgi:hypothetical protein
VTDARAERAILSHAEAYRLVAECQEQRARADAAEARLAALEAAGDALAEGVRVVGLRACRDACDHSLCVMARSVTAWRALRVIGEPQP